jgi:hypothetical protein
MRARKAPGSDRTHARGRRTAAVLAAASLAVGMLTIAARPAAASPDPAGTASTTSPATRSGDITPLGTCTSIGPIVRCGKIQNARLSDKYIVTTDNWPPSNGNWAWVYPGQRSPFKDTDGFFIPTNCDATDDWGNFWYGGTWTKIRPHFRRAPHGYRPGGAVSSIDE